jgi:pimeloyl-ACP methyl ester carboxylesterase
VSAPTLIVCQEHDDIHPVELGRVLGELMPNAELIVLGSEDELIARLPKLVTRVAAFLAEHG